MGCFDVFCIICGNSCNYFDFRNYNSEKNEFGNLRTKKMLNNYLDWINKCTILTPNNEIHNNCENSGCDGNSFIDKDNKNKYNIYNGHKILFFSYFNDDYKNKGIFLHTDCWKYIKKTYNKSLVYSDFPDNLITTIRGSVLSNINYGDIIQYWDQDMNYRQMYLDNNIWMACSPLKKDKKNNIRIKKIISQLKFKENRTGPSTSATFYQDGDIKVGNNGKIFEKKFGKWVEMKIEIITKLYTIKRDIIAKLHNEKKVFGYVPKLVSIINQIPQLGGCNNYYNVKVKPLFVNKFNVDKKNINIEFIGTEESIKYIDKIMNKYL
jgi:hypothetical protein